MSMPPPPPPGQGPPPNYRPYGYGYGYGAPPAEHPQGSTILVLGILSLVVCGLLGPFAWAMGNKALREMDAQPGTNFSNRGNVTAGRVCGMISSIILILGVAAVIVVVIIAAAGASS